MKHLVPSILLALLSVPLAAEEPKQKFNILHIHADDHRADCLGAFGNPVVKTPNLDKLVGSGLTFPHCYTTGSMTGAVCQPLRHHHRHLSDILTDINPRSTIQDALATLTGTEYPVKKPRVETTRGKRPL